MHWILQPNFFNEAAYQTVLEVLDRFNIPYSIEKWVPIFHVFENEPQLTSKNVMCFGTYALRQAAAERGWYPGVFDLEPYDFTVQLKHWGNYMLNADAEIVPKCRKSANHFHRSRKIFGPGSDPGYEKQGDPSNHHDAADTQVFRTIGDEEIQNFKAFFRLYWCGN